MRNQLLTELQIKFVHYLVNGATSAVEAARLAGYEGSAIRQNASQLMRKPHIQAAIKQEQFLRLNGRLANIALNTLAEVMTDQNAPAGARVSAAVAVLERAGLHHDVEAKQMAEVNKSVNEMTRDELESFIRASQHLLLGEQQSN
jgi:phage terminase small subunit